MALKTNSKIEAEMTNQSVAKTFDTLGQSKTITLSDRVSISTDRPMLIPLSLLIPYPGNVLLKLSNIEQLAQSIYETKLINPIAVVANNDRTYTIISGHRRTEAYKLLNQKYPDKDYNKIPSFIIPAEEIDSLEYIRKMWFDANFETRQLTIVDLVNNIEYMLGQISEMDEEDKKAIIVKLKGDEFSEEKYEKGIGRARHLNVAKYIYDKFKDYDVEEWGEPTIARYLYVRKNGTPELHDALMDSKIKIKSAREIASFSKEKQKKLLDIYLTNPADFYLRLKEVTDKDEAIINDIFIDDLKQLRSIIIKLNKRILTTKKNQVELSFESVRALEEIKKLIDNSLKSISPDISLLIHDE